MALLILSFLLATLISECLPWTESAGNPTARAASVLFKYSDITEHRIQCRGSGGGGSGGQVGHVQSPVSQHTSRLPFALIYTCSLEHTPESNLSKVLYYQG